MELHETSLIKKTLIFSYLLYGLIKNKSISSDECKLNIEFTMNTERYSMVVKRILSINNVLEK